MFTPANNYADDWRDESLSAWRPEPETDRVTVFWISTLLAACIFLQRFVIPLGPIVLPAPFVIGGVIVVYLLLRGRLVVSPRLCAMFFALMSIVTISSLVIFSAASSMMSYLYLLAIYLLYIFKLTYREWESGEIQEAYKRLMSFAAVCGIAQFCLQFVIGPELAFPLETFVPSGFLAEGYNVVIPLAYGSTIFRSNGIFFLEPSFFSQFLGLAILLELTGAQRPMRLVLYAAAILVSYSGTGTLLVAFFIPWILIKRGNLGLVLVGGCFCLVLVLAAGVLNLDMLTGRVGEFTETNSSGFARFVSPFFMLRDFVLTSPKTFLVGMGAGSIEVIMHEARFYMSHDPTWIKIVVEYGVIAAVLMLVFLVTSLFRESRNNVLSTAVLCIYLFLGGYLLNPFMHLLFVSLVAWHNGEDAVARPVREEEWDEPEDEYEPEPRYREPYLSWERPAPRLS